MDRLLTDLSEPLRSEVRYLLAVTDGAPLPKKMVEPPTTKGWVKALCKYGSGVERLGPKTLRELAQGQNFYHCLNDAMAYRNELVT